MGYYVRNLTWKRTPPLWKVQFISYKRSDFSNPKALKPQKEWDVKKERWVSLGFNNFMTLSAARVRARQLNRQLLIKQQEERLKTLQKTNHERTVRVGAFLPPEFVAEFEDRFIRTRDSENEAGRRRHTRAYSLWKAAQRMIVAIGKEPSDWYYHTLDIYDYFHQKQFSVRYIHSTLKIANLWGFFICKKMGRLFLPIPVPRGYERQRLINAYFEKERKTRTASKALLPRNLQHRKSKLNSPNYQWLYVSVWLGLRPQEIDNLHQKEMWSVETLGNGRTVLWVFQTKIVALPKEDRWKPIPLLLREQKEALAIIKENKFKRPLMKTIRKHFGEGVDLYGGRKGFTDLMLSRGHSLENISVWMGHSTLERTWKSYKNVKALSLKVLTEGDLCSFCKSYSYRLTSCA